jgi:hypothetical protein
MWKTKMRKSILGFVLGVALIGLALASVPGIVGVSASEEAAACPMSEVAVDQGYGVTTIEWQHVCAHK